MTAYGVRITPSSSSPALTRLGGSTPSTPGAAWNAIRPWSSMVRCSVAPSGVVLDRLGDTCYSDTDTTRGQKMVWLEKNWYYIDTSTAGQVDLWISNSAGDTITPTGGGSAQSVVTHPAFVTHDGPGGAAVEHDGVFLGTYEGYVTTVGSTNYLNSVAGVQPTSNVTPTNFRTYANNIGTRWGLQTIQSWANLVLRYLVEYASGDSQSQLGLGITNITDVSGQNVACNTGHTTQLGNASGGVSFIPSEVSQTTAQTAVSYRGYENPFGNIKIICDGLNLKAQTFPAVSTPYIADHGFTFDSTNGFLSPYAATNQLLILDYMWVTAFDFAQSAYNWDLLPTAQPNTTLTSNANSGQPSIVVASTTGFAQGQTVSVFDSAGSEWPYPIISTVNAGTNTITMTTNLVYNHLVSNGAMVAVVNGAYNTYFCDRVGTSRQTVSTCWTVGGNWNVGANNSALYGGIFKEDPSPLAVAERDVGARLQYLP